MGGGVWVEGVIVVVWVHFACLWVEFSDVFCFVSWFSVFVSVVFGVFVDVFFFFWSGGFYVDALVFGDVCEYFFECCHVITFVYATFSVYYGVVWSV